MKSIMGTLLLLLLTVCAAGCAADVSGLGSNPHVPQQPWAGNGNPRNCWINVNVVETEQARACRVSIPAEQGKQYRVRNRNRSLGNYRCGVGIVNRNNGVQCDLDPYVRKVR